MSVSLSCQSVGKSFPLRNGELIVLRDISFELEAGESAVIMGPSGSGKSTLLNILGTLDPPSSGLVTLDGVDPYKLTAPELARFRNERLGFVFQDQHLLGQCNVLENVLLPTLAQTGHPDATERARELLGDVGLQDRLEHHPAELSGGERQRVAIARALINEPAVVLADEPTGNLDQETAKRIAGLLRDLQRARQVTMLVVTHSSKLARRFPRRLDVVGGRLVPRRGN